MKNLVVSGTMVLAHLSAYACEPLGWRLVAQKQISATERQCVYEKRDVRVQILVNGLCPLSPC